MLVTENEIRRIIRQSLLEAKTKGREDYEKMLEPSKAKIKSEIDKIDFVSDPGKEKLKRILLKSRFACLSVKAITIISLFGLLNAYSAAFLAIIKDFPTCLPLLRHKLPLVSNTFFCQTSKTIFSCLLGTCSICFLAMIKLSRSAHAQQY